MNKQKWTVAGLVLATIVPRFIGLGKVLTIDEPLWLGRGSKFINAFSSFDFANTIPSVQPGVTTSWLAGMASRFDSLAASQFSVALTSSILILIATYLLTQLFGWRWGIISGFALALNPFLIAHSRVIHTDALLALFILLSVLSALLARPTEERGWQNRYLVFSAATFALASLTKLFALATGPALALIIFWGFWRSKENAVLSLRKFLLWGGFILVAGFLAWPAMWADSGKVIHYLWDRLQEFSGERRVGEISTHWWFYMRDGFVNLSVPTTILGLVGIWAVIREKNKYLCFNLLMLMLTGLLYALLLHRGSDRAARYILFTILVFDIWAVWGLRWLSNWLTKEKLGQKAALALLVIPLCWLSIDAARLHPHYLSHYNRLFPFDKQEQKHGWGEGLELAASWIYEQSPEAAVVTYYPRVFNHFWKQLGGEKEMESLEHLGENTNYLVLHRVMFERGPYDPATDFLNNYVRNPELQPVKTFEINGITYVWIYAHSPLK